MDTMQTEQVMQWEMYGFETAVSFSATADRTGFRVTLQRDQIPVVTSMAADTMALLRASSELRDHLQLLGYVPKAPPRPDHALEGGICWGPSSPLDVSLIYSMCGQSAAV